MESTIDNKEEESISKRFTMASLHNFLNFKYEDDIFKKTRKDRIVSARKVFVNLLHNMGFGPTRIGGYMNRPHDLMIHYTKTFSGVNPEDILYYNESIEYFNLPLEPISNINEILYGKNIAEVIDDLNKLSRKDFMLFKKTRLDPFLKGLEFEKKVKEIGEPSTRDDENKI